MRDINKFISYRYQGLTFAILTRSQITFIFKFYFQMNSISA